jgi:hypothetical protein
MAVEKTIGIPVKRLSEYLTGAHPPVQLIIGTCLFHYINSKLRMQIKYHLSFHPIFDVEAQQGENHRLRLKPIEVTLRRTWGA